MIEKRRVLWCLLTCQALMIISVAAHNDTEAANMALEKSSSLLEPSQELYQRIHTDLAAIRGSFAEVSDIKYQPNWYAGKILCRPDMSDEAVRKINESDFGPLKSVDRSAQYVAINFSRAYNSPVLINKLTETGLLNAGFGCRVDGILGNDSNIIYNYNKTYTFHRGLEANRLYWTFSVNNGTAVLNQRDKIK